MDRMFDRTKNKVGLGLADPRHGARQWIDEAAKTADDAIKLTAAGDGSLLETNSTDAMRLVSAIEKALEKSPDDLDLLVAKSGALCCAAQFKTAEEILDRVLAINPEHFEARMRKDHWERWQHLFQYPPWTEAARTLHPVMSAHLAHEHRMQIVRDRLQVGIAVVTSVQSQDFPQGLSNTMRSKWEPVWSDTPYGAIVAHYVLVEDNPADPYKPEAFLPAFVPDEVAPQSGYWLLQRLSHLGSCFIVLAEGDEVLYNRRYLFPEALQSTLRSIVEKMVRKAARKDPAAFQQACQWHMENFDMKRIRF
jgi:acyl carrier protein